MKIAVGTKNAAKVNAVKDVLIREQATIVTLSVQSNVSSQPLSDEETMQGAINRASGALHETDALLGLGLEGGVVETELGFMLCNWGALVQRDGGKWVASGAKLLLPKDVGSLLKDGHELGDIMKNITGDASIRQKQGAVGWYTGGWVNRKEMYTHIVKLLYGQFVASTNYMKH